MTTIHKSSKFAIKVNWQQIFGIIMNISGILYAIFSGKCQNDKGAVLQLPLYSSSALTKN
ncbi:hypothetical protein THS27_10290 [Thalassospira sp. MCCC 1A01428]|nr:hypothetical protein THS27_10290 [Thalassospira sp. MCCC 1A01428]